VSAKTTMRAFVAGAMLALAGFGSIPAQTSLDRTVVQAVADADQDRILIRWLQIEGATKRYTHFDVLRRSAQEIASDPINAEPIGPLTTAAAIEAVFTAPGRADALAGILDTFGADYASDLLSIQAPDATDFAALQLRMLPDLNYGAAIALGLGYLDESVTPDITYVYELWGLDDQGFRVERLGRASATARQPAPLPSVQGQACADLGDERADMAAFLRWDPAPPPAQGPAPYVAGYDLFRALRQGAACPVVLPGQPGVLRATRYPTSDKSPGKPAAGRATYAATCSTAGCHVAPGGPVDPRDLIPHDSNPALNGVKGGTIGRFRRFQNPALVPQGSTAVHAPVAIDPETLRAVFDWIHEFEFRDDGAHTPSEPLVDGATYCYQVLPRNLLGEHGAAPAQPAECLVRDRRTPEPPYAIRAARLAQGPDYETCEISWDRNSGPDDDTQAYELARAAEMPRVGEPDVTLVTPQPIPQPPTGRVVQIDGALGLTAAGQDYFYAARAIDDAGNRSAWSAWVPCVPRDLVPPPPTALSASCCPADPFTGQRPGFCEDRGLDGRWLSLGGDRVILTDPGLCPVRLDCGSAPDVFRCRLYRSFGEGDPRPDDDFDPAQGITGDFSPMIDQKVVWQVRTIDTSGNLGPLSNPVAVLHLGQFPLPAPRIVQVNPAGAGFLRIRFRSLEPHALLGFALYKRYQDPNEATPPAPAWEFVARFHDLNLSATPFDPNADPVEWAPKAAAKPLDQQPSGIQGSSTFECPDPGALPPDQPFLCHQPGGIYIMQVPIDETHDLVLRMSAVGWSGREGLWQPYTWDGWTPGDGVLDWPKVRSENYLFDAANAGLTATPGVNAGQQVIDVSWAPFPGGCGAGPAGPRPFIVFRKRGTATRWQQISPPFVCTGQPSSVDYQDRDIQSGFSYTYIVMRLTDVGEFRHRFGPATVMAP